MHLLPQALPMANGQASAAGGMLPMLLMLGAVLVLFWFMTRSQRKRQKQAMSFLDRLQVGQEVVTIGRMVGTITWIDGDIVTIETTPGTSFRILKNGIAKLAEGAEPEEVEDAEPSEADSASVVSEAESVVSQANASKDETEETINVNGEEIKRSELEGEDPEKKKD